MAGPKRGQVASVSKKKAKKLAQKAKFAAVDQDTMSDVSKRQEKLTKRLEAKALKEVEHRPVLLSTGAGTTLGGPESHIF